MLLIVIYLVAVAAGTWALMDVAQTPPEQLRSFSRPTWALITLVPFIGPAMWFASGARPTSGARSTRPSRAAGARRPLGPDDDPDFLRQLGRRPDPPA